VICSSKTRAEILVWQERLRLTGAVHLGKRGWDLPRRLGAAGGTFGRPEDGLSAIVFGTPYAELRQALHELRSTWGLSLRGFGDMTTEEIAEYTGLPLEDAALAQRRDFDEPFYWLSAPPRRDWTRFALGSPAAVSR